MKNSIFSNLLWRFAERSGAQGVSFIVYIILARLLMPEDYGTVELLSIFITILNVFVDSGLGNALIQKKDADDLDFSSVFYFNLIWSVVLYALLYLSAPLIAQFYNNERLIPLVRVAGLVIVVAGIKNIQQAYISRTMQFKKFFYATLGGTLISAVIGIYMAYQGYGAWALVAQNLINAIVDTAILWVIVKWYPKRIFSFKRLVGLLSYGWKLLLSALLDTTYNNLRSLAIGKVYSTEELAYFSRGSSWPSMIISNINASIDSVLLPAMSDKQDQVASVKAMTQRAIQVSSYIIWPIMIGLMAISQPLIRWILTDKWLPCVPYICIFCFTYAFWPIHTANLNAIKALGRSDLFLKMEIEKKVIGIIALLIAIPYGVMAIAITHLLTVPFSLVINTLPNKKLLDYSIGEQMRDILAPVAVSVVMGILVWRLQFLGLPDFLTVILQVIIGMLIYFFITKIMRLKSYQYIWNLINNYRK